jgi:lipopolysaccharide transport system ATP-binding protein
MSSDIAIKVVNLNKFYQIYNKPFDRLKQFLLPRLTRLIGMQPKAYYRKFWALRDVSFTIKRGETVGIIGRNGSGKSTLLQMICGTLNPTDGNIETHGRMAALLELGSGFNPEFTGRENVYMNASVLGLSREDIDARFEDIVAFADIDDFIDQPVKTYSSGMYVRLAFAVIAHVDADILVVDEALAVGDAFFVQKCMRFLRNFMKTGTVIFVSHDTGAVKNLCNHALWLEKGEILKQGTPKEICDLYLQAFYEAQQGKSSTTKLKAITPHDSILPRKDQRLEFLNTTTLRNDLQIFKFDPEAASFGKGGAQIINVELLGEDGYPLSWVVGGELVTLQVNVIAHDSLDSPIIGFYIKDRLGQALFGDNTYLTYRETPVSCKDGEDLLARFTFFMPILVPGDYSINVAIADGSQETHIQHQWIHDAVIFRSETSSVTTGLIGIPMQRIELGVTQMR